MHSRALGVLRARRRSRSAARHSDRDTRAVRTFGFGAHLGARTRGFHRRRNKGRAPSHRAQFRMSEDRIAASSANRSTSCSVTLVAKAGDLARPESCEHACECTRFSPPCSARPGAWAGCRRVFRRLARQRAQQLHDTFSCVSRIIGKHQAKKSRRARPAGSSKSDYQYRTFDVLLALLYEFFLLLLRKREATQLKTAVLTEQPRFREYERAAGDQFRRRSRQWRSCLQRAKRNAIEGCDPRRTQDLGARHAAFAIDRNFDHDHRAQQMLGPALEQLSAIDCVDFFRCGSLPILERRIECRQPHFGCCWRRGRANIEVRRAR